MRMRRSTGCDGATVGHARVHDALIRCHPERTREGSRAAALRPIRRSLASTLGMTTRHFFGRPAAERQSLPNSFTILLYSPRIRNVGAHWPTNNASLSRSIIFNVRLAAMLAPASHRNV